jgi:hypothetical protein
MVRRKEGTVLAIQQIASSRLSVRRGSISAGGFFRSFKIVRVAYSFIPRSRISAMRPITDSSRTPQYVAEVPKPEDSRRGLKGGTASVIRSIRRRHGGTQRLICGDARVGFSPGFLRSSA